MPLHDDKFFDSCARMCRDGLFKYMQVLMAVNAKGRYTMVVGMVFISEMKAVRCSLAQHPVTRQVIPCIMDGCYD